MIPKKLINQSGAQISAEFILLLAGIIIIVLLAMDIYKQYITDFTNQMNDSEVKTLMDEIDNLNGKL